MIAKPRFGKYVFKPIVLDLDDGPLKPAMFFFTETLIHYNPCFIANKSQTDPCKLQSILQSIILRIVLLQFNVLCIYYAFTMHLLCILLTYYPFTIDWFVWGFVWCEKQRICRHITCTGTELSTEFFRGVLKYGLGHSSNCFYKKCLFVHMYVISIIYIYIYDIYIYIHNIMIIYAWWNLC